jgi:hypothetical protein
MLFYIRFFLTQSLNAKLLLFQVVIFYYFFIVMIQEASLFLMAFNLKKTPDSTSEV